MTTELFYLALAAGLALILWVPYVVARIFCWGIGDAAGYPTDPPELPVGLAAGNERTSIFLRISPHLRRLLWWHRRSMCIALTRCWVQRYFSGPVLRMPSCSLWVFPCSERSRSLLAGSVLV